MDKKYWEGSLGDQNCPLQPAACPMQCPGADRAAGESHRDSRKCSAEHPGCAAAQKTSHEASRSVREKWELIAELVLILMPTAEAGKSSRDLPAILLQACLSRHQCCLEKEIQEKGLGQSWRF